VRGPLPLHPSPRRGRGKYFCAELREKREKRQHDFHISKYLSKPKKRGEDGGKKRGREKSL